MKTVSYESFFTISPRVWRSLATLLLCCAAATLLVLDAFRSLSKEAGFAVFDEIGLPKRCLITGSAGFIGFHLAKRLASNSQNLIVALDNFNEYYDVQLKIDRAFQLAELGVIVYKDDVCNGEFLYELMVKYNFTHVIHLAAQAGVRYSLEDPWAYITANFECNLVLLETLKHFRDTSLVYASSSSVYGKHSKVPFDLQSNTRRPGNMYAATKKADELLSCLYCQMYNLSTVGLRFFTVYGPWGRPDMAIYKFVQLVQGRKEVPLYESSIREPLSRDFTYIDDVINGIESVIDYRPHFCGEVFNLGFGQPVSVLEMIQIIEKELGIRANIKRLQLPATEILQTWANISESVMHLGFSPKTSLVNGIRAFVAWYRYYHFVQLNSSQLEAKKLWYKRIEEERINRLTKYNNRTKTGTQRKFYSSNLNSG